MLLLCLSLSPGWAQTKPDAAITPVRVADETCSPCHREIYDRYLHSPMANASGLAIDHPIAGKLDHAPSGISYSLSLLQGDMWLSYQGPNGGEPQGKRRLRYFLGSGHMGVTYMYTVDGYLLESPIAYYTSANRLDMKPGLESLRTMAPALPMSSQCMRCHMSEVQTPQSGTANRYTGAPFLHGGITCESCHGDTAKHVSDRGRSKALNPARLDPERRDSVCISCHLEGDTSVEHLGRSLADYKPGDRISDYVAYFGYREADLTTRGVSEVEELEGSRCKRASGARMSCMSCHDPHGGPPAEQKASFYRQKCLVCHSAPGIAKEHYPSNPDCTACHMPTGKAENIPHVAWTDHRILRTPASAVSFSALNPAPRELVPILSGTPPPRDFALAYYNRVAEGDLDQRAHALQAIRELPQSGSSDPTLVVARAYLSQLSGDRVAAKRGYRETLEQEPTNLFAANNLGGMLAQEGELRGATSLWKAAFARNEDVESLGLNLAIGECKLGDKAEALAVLQRILDFSPGSSAARAKQKQIESGQEPCGPTP